MQRAFIGDRRVWASQTAAEGMEGDALFLDFDGTIVDIAERPEAVVVDPGLPSTLGCIRDELGGALALVSGRTIDTLDAFLAPERFDAAGVHGVERRVAGALLESGVEDRPALNHALEVLGCFTASHEGLLLEDKGSSFAVHWRLRPDLADEALRLVEAAAARLSPGYRLQQGKAVAEILPSQAGKGAAIAWFMERPPYRGRRPIFIGDDLTDEHGFVAVNERNGISVRVGDGPTVATRRVASPAGLKALLQRWASSGRSPFGGELDA